MITANALVNLAVLLSAAAALISIIMAIIRHSDLKRIMERSKEELSEVEKRSKETFKQCQDIRRTQSQKQQEELITAHKRIDGVKSSVDDHHQNGAIHRDSAREEARYLNIMTKIEGNRELVESKLDAQEEKIDNIKMLLTNWMRANGKTPA